jgi:transposase
MALMARGRPKKLTPEQRAEIVSAYDSGQATQAELARLYNVSVETIQRVLGRKRATQANTPSPTPWTNFSRTPLETEAWQDFMARRHEIPKGPVTLNQALLGDPLKGRSALDRRK